MFQEHWWRATVTTPRTTNSLAGPTIPTNRPVRLTSTLTDVKLASVAGGTEGPPVGAGDGNGVASGKATPILF